nr:Chain P, R18 PEPTIDE (PHCVPRDLSWLDLEANMCLP) [synthetic construct]1A38_Q Chain Q, R18 PEPTIDE (PHCVPRDLSWLDLEANMCLP) [synthetic construct]
FHCVPRDLSWLDLEANMCLP